MPEFNVLNILPAQELIRRIFLERITKAKGLTRVQEMTGDILMPTPAAVLKAAVLLSKGTKSEKGFNDLLVVDVGGATTDVYSITDGSPQISAAILKGIPEPYEKRTVEGDLGVRHSAVSLAEAAGIDEIAARSCISSEEACRLIDMISKKPDLLASDDKEIGRIDNALAPLAVKLAVERHAGRLSTAFTISGEVFIQTGKDLGSVETIIGTGGSVINGKTLRQYYLKHCVIKTIRSIKARKGENYARSQIHTFINGFIKCKYRNCFNYHEERAGDDTMELKNKILSDDVFKITGGGAGTVAHRER